MSEKKSEPARVEPSAAAAKEEATSSNAAAPPKQAKSEAAAAVAVVKEAAAAKAKQLSPPPPPPPPPPPQPLPARSQSRLLRSESVASQWDQLSESHSNCMEQRKRIRAVRTTSPRMHTHTSKQCSSSLTADSLLAPSSLHLSAIGSTSKEWRRAKQSSRERRRGGVCCCLGRPFSCPTAPCSRA